MLLDQVEFYNNTYTITKLIEEDSARVRYEFFNWENKNYYIAGYLKNRKIDSMRLIGQDHNLIDTGWTS